MLKGSRRIPAYQARTFHAFTFVAYTQVSSQGITRIPESNVPRYTYYAAEPTERVPFPYYSLCRTGGAPVV